MPVDKFGRNVDIVYTGINIANLTSGVLSRDGGSTAFGAIDINNHIIQNVADPLSNQDVATKNYVDENFITTAGGVVSCDIKLNVVSDLVRCLWCYDFTTGKKFTLLLGQTQMCYHTPNSIHN